MCDHPLLSVIVPVYNTETYLNHCLDSILAQDFTDYELILVDDGSTDRSGDICDRYAAAHPHIRCLHQTNGGHTCARQNGVRASRGEYIAFVDSDDWIDPGMYRRMCRAAKETGADIIHCDFTAVMPHKSKVCGTPFSPGLYDKKQLENTVYPSMIYFGTYFVFGIAPNLWNKLFRRSILEHYLFRLPHDIIVGEDGPITYACMLEAASVYFCEEAFYNYRSNTDSVSHHMNAKRLAENHVMFDTYRQFIDTAAYPYIQKQLQYFFVYQSLLTFVPIFQSMRTEPARFRQLFLTECSDPHIREAFKAVPLKEITGLHNKLYAFCVRHKLARLFRFLLPKRQES